MRLIDPKQEVLDGDSGGCLILEQAHKIYGSLCFHSAFFFLTVLLYRWGFRRMYRAPIESFGIVDLLAFLFLAGVFGITLFGYGKAISILLRSAKKVMRQGDTILVDCVLGHWEGPVQEIRLRKASLGWITTLGRVRYQLELVGGGRIAELVVLGKPAEEGFARLQECVQTVEEGEEDFRRTRRAERYRTAKESLAFFCRHWPWVGKLLLVGQIAGFYLALVGAAAKFVELGAVSVSALAIILIEVLVVLALLGALRAGIDVHQSVDTAFKFLHVLVGIFVASVAWEWLGGGIGYTWLVVVIAGLQAMAVILEWMVPGAVFSSFSRSSEHKRATSKPPDELVNDLR